LTKKIAITVVLSVAVVLALSSRVVKEGLDVMRTAVSGKTTVMWRYASWGANCEAMDGVVKVLVKPQHGKLSHQDVEAIAESNRYNPKDPCIGKLVQMFEVEYTSDPNFRGRDTFKIERTLWDGRRDIDTFTVYVRSD
jgi:hypothetical protein